MIYLPCVESEIHVHHRAHHTKFRIRNSVGKKNVRRRACHTPRQLSRLEDAVFSEKEPLSSSFSEILHFRSSTHKSTYLSLICSNSWTVLPSSMAAIKKVGNEESASPAWSLTWLRSNFDAHRRVSNRVDVDLMIHDHDLISKKWSWEKLELLDK